MLHFGRVHAPLQIATYNVEEIFPIRKVIFDEEVHQLDTYWEDAEHKKMLMPHRECAQNCYCCNQCDLILRDDADYIASRILRENPEKLKDKKEFVKFLVSMNTSIMKIVEKSSSMKLTKQLINCVKIKYFRKALLEVPFKITDEEYRMILNHNKFLYSKES